MINILQLFFVFTIFSSFSYSIPILKVNSFKTNSNGMTQEFIHFIKYQIYLGGINGKELRIDYRLEWENLPGIIQIDKESNKMVLKAHNSYWHLWPRKIRKLFIDKTFDLLDAIKAYKVIYSNTDLSPLQNKYIYNDQVLKNSNCWYIALDNIIQMPRPSYIMTANEFIYYLESFFYQMNQEEILLPGDIIRMQDKETLHDEHAAVVIGYTVENNQLHFLVGSKNGKTNSKFVIVDFETLKNKIYPNTEVTFYRLKNMEPGVNND